MVLLPFFEISSGFWSTKKLIRLGLHVSPRTLWLGLLAKGGGSEKIPPAVPLGGQGSPKNGKFVIFDEKKNLF